jgi:hypothetical protein
LLKSASNEHQRLSATELMKAEPKPVERKQRSIQDEQQKIALHHLRVKLRDKAKDAPKNKVSSVVPIATKEPVKDVSLSAAGKHTQKLIRDRQKPKPDSVKPAPGATVATHQPKRKRTYDRER